MCFLRYKHSEFFFINYTTNVIGYVLFSKFNQRKKEQKTIYMIMIKKLFLKPIMLLLISFIFFTGSNLSAQSFKINPKTSSMTILGTTNVHNFKSKVEQINGELTINSSKQAQSLVVVIPVQTIKSGEKLMDTKTYETFNYKKFPTISFKMTEATSLVLKGADISVTVTGNLTMAGVTKRITFKSTGVNLKPGVYEFKGTIPVKMTDFDMKPPTAMLGVMKVADAITLKYDVYLEGSPIN